MCAATLVLRRNIPAWPGSGKKRIVSLRVAAASAALLLLPAAAARAAGPDLGLPVDCTVGETCWIMNYVDADPGPGRADYRCGNLSYDGHNGTDFMVRDLAAVDAGVAVRAAAVGVVQSVRDGMPDTGLREPGAADAIAGRECGNGVVLRHADGWVTQYCHMRRGSLAVGRGAEVGKGTVLGMVGMSGQAERPHLHFVVRRGERVIDPFVGETPGGTCAAGRSPLWDDTTRTMLPYRSVYLFNAGFAAALPTEDGLMSGLYQDNVLPATAPALILWLEIVGPRKADDIAMRILGPDGEAVLDHRDSYDGRFSAYRLFYAGKRRRPLRWPAGIYTGEITFRRADAPEGPVERRVVRRIEVR